MSDDLIISLAWENQIINWETWPGGWRKKICQILTLDSFGGTKQSFHNITQGSETNILHYLSNEINI